MLPASNAAVLLDRAAQQFPGRTLLIAGDQRLSYAQVDARARQFAALLAHLGIQAGQTIALLLPNSPDFIVCYFGALKLGVIVAPLNITSPPPELAHFLNDSGAALLVAAEALLPAALSAVQQAPGCRHVLAAGEPGAEPLPPPVQWLAPRLAAAPASFATASLEPEAVALLLYTSGTTGKPKAAMVTHQNVLAFTPVFAQGVLELDGDSVVLMTSPGSHAIGQVLLNTAVFAQCTLSLLPRFDLALFLQAVQRDRVTAFISVPSLVQMLLATPTVTEEALHSLRTVMVGGAALAPELAARFMQRFNVRLKVAYAMTEAYAITFGCVDQIPAGSAGKPAAGVALRVVDEAGRDLPPGQPGEVLVRSPQVFRGYHNLPDQAQSTWLDGWFRSGDAGYLDEDGYLFLVARIKETIKTSGYSVYPAEVEAVLQAHPQVAMAAVVGLPHASLGEVIVAFVVRKPGGELTAREVINFCKGRLAAYKCPRRVEFREKLPLTSAGKVLRKQLIEELN